VPGSDLIDASLLRPLVVQVLTLNVVKVGGDVDRRVDALDHPRPQDGR
jgi:hypothetical protein